MNPKELTDRLIKSMEEEPDSWRVVRDGRIYLRHKSGIDVACEGSYYVDIKTDTTIKGERHHGAEVSLGFWNHRSLRVAAKDLLREKTMRMIDRNELLSD